MNVQEMLATGSRLYIAGNFTGTFSGITRQSDGVNFLLKASLDAVSADITAAATVKVFHGAFKPGKSENCQVQYTILAAENVTIAAYNSIGEKVRLLYEGTAPAGVSTLNWDGKDDNGELVPSGVYIIRIEPGTDQKRVVVIR